MDADDSRAHRQQTQPAGNWATRRGAALLSLRRREEEPPPPPVEAEAAEAAEEEEKEEAAAEEEEERGVLPPLESVDPLRRSLRMRLSYCLLLCIARCYCLSWVLLVRTQCGAADA